MLQKNQFNLAKTLPEIFAHVGEADNFDQKVQMLHNYHTRGLKWFVNAMYNREWSDLDIPKFKHPHRPAGNTHMTIGKATRRIDSAFNSRNTKPELTERQLTLILEDLSSDEADLLLNLFADRRGIENISKAVFKRVYPDLFTEG